MMINRLLSIVIFSCTPFVLLAQDRLPHANLTSVFQPSPNAAQPSADESIGVDHYTGALQLSIPVFNYNSGATNLQHSVRLSYRGGGVRADDVASNVGLGWSCDAALNVSRVIKGIPDEAPATGGSGSILGRIVDNVADGERDVYTYSTGNSSGQFIVGSSGIILTIPRSNVRIEFLSTPYSFSAAPLDSCVGTQVKITDLDGTQYYYADFNCSKLDYGDTSSSRIHYNISTWYITKIVSAYKKDSILFSYTPFVLDYGEAESYTSYSLQTNYNPPAYQDNLITSNYTTRIRDRRLSSIDYPDGTHLSFNYQLYGRLDLNSDQALASIIISNGGSSYRYQFDYSYANAYGQWMTDQDYSGTGNWGKGKDFRLFLKGVKKVAGSASLPGYVFDYITPALPARGQGSIDHWGYLSNSAGSRIPAMFIPSANYPPAVVLDGGSRKPDDACKYGSLYRITSPLGGTTELEYELHTANVQGILYPDFNLSTTGETQSLKFSNYNQAKTFTLGVPTSGLYDQLTIQPASWPSSIPTSSRIGIKVYRQDASNGANNNNTVFQGELSYSDFISHDPINDIIRSYPTDTLRYQLYTNPVQATGAIQNVIFQVSWNRALDGELVTPPATDQRIGGLRIKKIITSDGLSSGANNQVREYEYTLENGRSSGVLGSIPKYGLPYTETYVPNPSNHQRPATAPASGIYESYNLVGSYVSGAIEEASAYDYIVRSAWPVNELIYTHGSPVGYKRVIEYAGTKSRYKRKTVHEFTTLADPAVDLIAEDIALPYPPKPVLDFAAGLPVKVSEYLQSGILSSKSVNEYSIFPEYKNLSSFGSKKVIQRLHPRTMTSPYFSADYYPVTGKVFPVRSTLVQYFAGNDSMVKVTETTFDTAHMVTRTTSSTDAIGRVVFSKNYYPFDFSVSGPIATLNSMGIVHNPIRTEVWRQGSSSQELLNASVSSFQVTGANIVRQLGSYALTTTSPISSGAYGSFNPYAVLPAGQPFTQLANMDAYDSKGNLVQSTAKGVTTSTIWDYRQSRPVAQVSNAGIGDIAYTSFEADGLGSWGYTIGSVSFSTLDNFTGTRCARILPSGSISRSGLSSNKTYVVSCWGKGSITFAYGVGGADVPILTTASETHRGWTLYTAVVTNATIVKVKSFSPATVFVDELRLYPVGAAMSTSTYDPLFGITSSCDPSNKTSYFEYDAFGRMTVQRDQDGNIRKLMEYKAQEQQ